MSTISQQPIDITPYIKKIKQFSGHPVATLAIPPNALRSIASAICTSKQGLAGLTWTIDPSVQSQKQPLITKQSIGGANYA